MKKLIQYFIKYPVSGNVILVLFFLFGWFGLQSLKSSFFPLVESRMINIQVAYPGASPEEMEKGIVLKIEQNLKGITGIDRVTSTSSENTANVNVEVLESHDPDKVLQDVKNAVDRISSFPTGIEPPVIFKREGSDFAINFSVSGDVDLRTLKKYAKGIERDLLAIDGISKISISGYPAEEIVISLREDDLKAYNLTFEQVASAIRSSNIEITGGIIKGQKEELLIRARNKSYYAEGFRDIVVKAENERKVLLSDVAVVENRWSDNPNRAYLDGKPSVKITVNKTINEDIIQITDYVRDKYIPAFNQDNDEVQLTIIRDGSETLNQRIDVLLKNGFIGAILVLLLLSLFLNVRLAFWVAIGIPVSFFGMFILASFYGLTINVISLFGMILVIGILVDDGIIISENIFQHFERGKPPLKASIDGIMEVFPAVFSAVLTTCIAFSTFFFLAGHIGEFIASMAFVVIVTLGVSLIEGALILPAHISHSGALKKRKKQNKLEKAMTDFMNYMKFRIYGPVLNFCLHNKALTIAIPIALLLITFGAMQGGFLQTTFFPFIDRDNIDINLTMPAGTRDYITEKHLIRIEKAAREVNETFRAEREDGLDVIKNITRKVGPGTHQGKLDISLLNGEQRNMESFMITNAIRKKVGPIHEAEKLTYGAISIFGKPVSVSLLGNNLQELEAVKDELKAELRQLNSLKDIVDTDEKGLKEVNIRLKEKAKSLGLQLRDIIAQVRQGFFGLEVQRLQRGDDEVKVWVRFQDESRSSLHDLEEMYIRLPDGRKFPVGELVDYDIERGVISINHRAGMREIKVEAEMANKTQPVPVIIEEIENNILPPILDKHPSVKASFEGQKRQTDKTSKSGQMIVPLILVLMFSSIVLTFRSFVQAFVVFLMIPFGFIGVGAGHMLHGHAISILSVYGIIALVGVMVNDSLVLISAFNNLMREGKSFMEAVYEASLSRFRPIFLTSITTIAGLGPLILEKSRQAQFLIPMAIAVAYGILIATMVTLIILPVTLVLFNYLKQYLKWLWEGKRPSAEAVEPAYIEKEQEENA